MLAKIQKSENKTKNLLFFVVILLLTGQHVLGVDGLVEPFLCHQPLFEHETFIRLQSYDFFISRAISFQKIKRAKGETL